MINAPNLYRVLNIDDLAVTPKYIQISNCIIKGIETLPVESGYVLPSINDMSYELDISRDTVVKAYQRLKELGVIDSIAGKGYYITNDEVKNTSKVLVLFNSLSANKKAIYDEFVNGVGSSVEVDLKIYNNDFNKFRNIIQANKNSYNYYVIIPPVTETKEELIEILGNIKTGKILLLDNYLKNLITPCSLSLNNFEEDTFEALEKALKPLSKFKTLVLSRPKCEGANTEIENGFIRFCETHGFKLKLVSSFKEVRPVKGQAYISLTDDELLNLLGSLKETKLIIGKEIGILSYNDAPWKAFVGNGITTISTDYKKMSNLAAAMILEEKYECLKVSFEICLRQSL